MSGYRLSMLSKWLEAALESAQITQAELARRLTEELGRSIDRAAVNKMVAGKRAIAADELLAIQRITGETAPQTMTVPLKGYVGAGQAVEAVAHGGDENVEAPAEAHADTVAVMVRGESMFPIYEDGTILYYSRLLPPEEMVNRRCVAQLEDGRILVKILRPGSVAGLWTLQSVNVMTPDIVDVAIRWVARIDWVKPA